MRNPAITAFAIADLGNLNKGNVVGLVNDAEHAAELAVAPTQVLAATPATPSV